MDILINEFIVDKDVALFDIHIEVSSYCNKQGEFSYNSASSDDYYGYTDLSFKITKAAVVIGEDEITIIAPEVFYYILSNEDFKRLENVVIDAIENNDNENT